MPRWRATSTRAVCPIRTWWFAPPAKCDSATSCSGRRRTPSSTAPRRSGQTSPMRTSMRRSPHTSGASVALARAPRRSPIEVADATTPAEPPLAAPRRSNMVIRIATAAVLIAVVLAVLILGSGWVFGAIWVGDTAAMVAGLRFGRHRFFSRISPKKTVEGAVAELLASTVFFAIVGLFLNISFPHNLIIGLLIGVFAQVGDLVESQIKRTAGVKDASQLIPGHGGVLDRIDSLLLVGVVVYYYVTFLHLA